MPFTEVLEPQNEPDLLSAGICGRVCCASDIVRIVFVVLSISVM